MWLRWLATLTGPRGGSRSLRTVATANGEPYRSDPLAPPTERTAEPRPIDDVYGALRDAGLAVRALRRGFEVIDPAHERGMQVRVRDPRRVTPDGLGCGAEAPELLLDLALALVPLFGPVIADVRFAGPILVDGTRDRQALGEEAARRIQRVGERVAVRAPASFPLLHELALRMRQR